MTKQNQQRSRRKVKSFSFAEEDLALLDALQTRLWKTGRLLSESETVRVALRALYHLPEKEIEGVMGEVRRLKPGPLSRYNIAEDE